MPKQNEEVIGPEPCSQTGEGSEEVEKCGKTSVNSVQNCYPDYGLHVRRLQSRFKVLIFKILHIMKTLARFMQHSSGHNDKVSIL